MTGITVKRNSLLDAIVYEPLELAKAQFHQVLLSSGSVTIMAQFAAHGQIVPWYVGGAVALGVEWAYLRGLASDAKSHSVWGSLLNWSAFGIMTLWGILWVATIYGAIPEKPIGAAAFWLACAHIVPIAWISLCSAQCHRQMLMTERTERNSIDTAERERQKRLQEAADEIELDRQRKEQELALWQKAQEAKLALRSKAPAKAQPTIDRPNCPMCDQQLSGTDYALYKSALSRSAKFNGCKQCREKRG